MIVQDNLEKIRKNFSNYISFGEKEWTGFSSFFKIAEVKKRTILHKDGEISKYLYYINSGLLRVFFIDRNGTERTFHFAFEDTFVTNYESFIKSKPSNYIIQAIENTQIVKIPYSSLVYAYNNIEYGERLGRLLAEEYIFNFTKKIEAIYTKTPLERYLSFNKYYPNIHERIPQHYIASYLNITPVHLSRLINQVNSKSNLR